MGHGQNTLVVVLVVAAEFAIDGVPGAAAADALRATVLGHEVGDDLVKLEAFMKPSFASFTKFATVFGESFSKNSTVMVPWSVMIFPCLSR